MRDLGLATLLVVVWLSLTLLLGGPLCPACEILLFGAVLKIPGVQISYPHVGVIVLVLLALVPLALYLIPWRQLGNADAWRGALKKWLKPWIWLCIAVVLSVVGEIFFALAKSSLPSAITNVAEQFSITGTLSIGAGGDKGSELASLTPSLGGLVGLAIGFCLFLQFGVSPILGATSKSRP